MTNVFNEDALEQAALEWFEELGYEKVFGPDIAPAPDGTYPEREDYSDVVLSERLKCALRRVNPDAPPDALDEAFRRITRSESPSLIANNRNFQRMICDGVDVEIRREDGSARTVKIWLFDFERPERNDWAAVNQFTIIEHGKKRRPDIIVFVNGLPLAVIELKSASSESATIHKAYNQLQTYKAEIQSLMVYNAFLVISDGANARIGSLTASAERFMMWRTIDGSALASAAVPQLEVMIRGVFEKGRMLEMLRHFILFQDDGENISKIVAGYHQYHAVRKAIEQTYAASAEQGDRRIGVIWHTQGSGKSLSMVFYAGRLILGMDNPTIVIVTDRNDLDNQLFDTFSKSGDILRQSPKQAENRAHLRELLSVEAGGIIFSTLQKFSPGEDGDAAPLLTDRRNVVVIADEAHRSQYGFSADVASGKDEAFIKYGYAKYMRDALPNASFIGFTGTPIEEADKNTPVVFGDYIDIYDMSRAIADGTTVKIYYESRIAKIRIPEEQLKTIDEQYEEVAEEAGEIQADKYKSKWTRVEAIVGAEDRLRQVAQDIVDHYEKRLDQSFGKAMIVTMSRRVAVDLYNQIIKLRPQWHSDDDARGVLKIVMTGSAGDPQEFQPHIRNKAGRKHLEKRMKDNDDELKLVIVRDMWLTGFDAPSLHTMYVDKPMKGHNLMQAIARVNRVFKDKPGGLIVDYIGIADDLKKALRNYSETDREGTGIDTSVAVDLMREKYEILKGILHGFDYSQFFAGSPADKMRVIMETVNFILELEENRQKQFIKTANALAKAYSLCSTRDEARALNEDVGFFKTVKSALVKLLAPAPQERSSGGTGSDNLLDKTFKQLVSQSVISEEVVDVFEGTGLKKPDLSILSDEFLEEIRKMEYKNIAVEILKKLLEDKIRGLSKRDLVTSRKFSEKLQNAVSRLLGKAIDSFQMLTELIDMAKDMQHAIDQGNELGLESDEYAFYNALADNDSAKDALGDEILKTIAQELTASIKKSMSVDWTLRESVRAKMRVLVKRLLKKYKYPPDKAQVAIETVMKQAELMCDAA